MPYLMRIHILLNNASPAHIPQTTHQCISLHESLMHLHECRREESNGVVDGQPRNCLLRHKIVCCSAWPSEALVLFQQWMERQLPYVMVWCGLDPPRIKAIPPNLLKQQTAANVVLTPSHRHRHNHSVCAAPLSTLVRRASRQV